MAFFEDMFKGNIGTGLAIGVGVAVVGPILTPILGGLLRPAAKAVIKAGIIAYDTGREGAGRLMNEAGGDIVAEARAEVNEARSEPGRRPGTATAGAGSKSG